MSGRLHARNDGYGESLAVSSDDPSESVESSTPQTASPDSVAEYLRVRHERRSAGAENGRRPTNEADRRANARASEGRAPDATAFLAELSESQVSKPYLDRLPDEYSAQLELFEWLDGLLSAAGREAATEALEYYRSIGWLSERSREELAEIAGGLAVSDAVDGSLDIEDHRESLLYIARLAHRSC